MGQESFEERFYVEYRWVQGEECLNMDNINLPPCNYAGNKENWIKELTTFIFLYPKEWQEIEQEYRDRLKARGKIEIEVLHYFRDDEGYLRKEGEKDIYLVIHIDGIQGVEPLKLIEDFLSCKLETGLQEYEKYCKMSMQDKKGYLCHVKRLLAREYDIEIGKIRTSFEPGFNGTLYRSEELYVDFLNSIYIIL